MRQVHRRLERVETLELHENYSRVLMTTRSSARCIVKESPNNIRTPRTNQGHRVHTRTMERVTMSRERRSESD